MINFSSAQVSSWSKRWFTHIFLFVIVFLYSIVGAMIFMTVEGTHEEILHFNIRKERYAKRKTSPCCVSFRVIKQNCKDIHEISSNLIIDSDKMDFNSILIQS